MNRFPKAVLFDLDGTLADTVGDICTALNLAMALKGAGPFDVAGVRQMVGAGALKLIIRAMLASKLRPNQFDAQYLNAAFNTAYDGTPCASTILYPGTLDTLKSLKTAGCKLAVVSNKPHDLTEKVITGLEISTLFDFILGASNAHALKPSGAMIRAAAHALGVEPVDTVMVGDSSNDVDAARSAGCPVVVVDYGYSDDPAHTLGADAVISDMGKLPDTLIKLR